MAIHGAQDLRPHGLTGGKVEKAKLFSLKLEDV